MPPCSGTTQTIPTGPEALLAVSCAVVSVGPCIMYCACMATKTISLELDAVWAGATTEHIGHYSREAQRRQLGCIAGESTVVMTGATKRAAETRATDEQIDLLVYSSLGEGPAPGRRRSRCLAEDGRCDIVGGPGAGSQRSIVTVRWPRG